MQKQFDDTNRGVLFNNRDRKKTDKDRDYGGKINIEGTDYWLSGWIKTGQKGNFLALSAQKMESQRTTSQRAEARDDEHADEVEH